jgi:translation initiation factor 1
MNSSRLVFTTEGGRVCPECGRPVGDCRCRRKPEKAAGDGVVRIRRETKGRGGKTATVVDGLALDEDALARLASELKRRCATGGAVKDGTIIIQGDHREALLVELVRRGFNAKLSGG